MIPRLKGLSCTNLNRQEINLFIKLDNKTASRSRCCIKITKLINYEFLSFKSLIISIYHNPLRNARKSLDLDWDHFLDNFHCYALLHLFQGSLLGIQSSKFSHHSHRDVNKHLLLNKIWNCQKMKSCLMFK